MITESAESELRRAEMSVQTRELKKAQDEIQSLSGELEQKVEERTRELAATNEALRLEIAERKLAQEALKQAEDRIRLVIDTIPTMAWSLRPDGIVDFVNQRWVDYTGVSFQDAIREPTDIVHPEDLPRVLEKWDKDMAAGQASEDEMRLRRADGEYRWFLVRTVPERDEQGAVLKWYGTSTDIEDRKQGEMAARALIDAIPHHIWSTPAEGGHDYCNDRWRSYTGLEPGDLRGGGWQTTIHPEDRDRVLKAWSESVVNGTPFEQEERCRGIDGTYRWFLSLAVPLRDAQGRIVRWYGTNTDIEDRKRAEEALRKSEKLFTAFMDHLPGFAWIKNVEGRYVYINETFLQLRNAVGKTDAELWPAGIASTYRANDNQVIQTKNALQTIEPFPKEPEQGCQIVSKFPILDQDGAVVMVGGASVDISELIQAEKALEVQALRYKTLMETSTDSIYVLDAEGNLQEANAAFLRRRGYTAAEGKGLNVADWDWQPHQFQERRQQLVGRSSVFETRHRCKDGSLFDVEVCATGLPVEGEQLIFCVTREITERKQAEAALAARARQQAVVAELGKLALAGGDLQPLFDHTARQVAETLGVEYCKVLELLPDGSALKLVAGVGWKEGLVGQTTVGAGCDSQAGFALLTKDLVIVDDLRSETRFKGPPLLRDHDVVSGLSFIIGELEKPFGVLGAHTAKQRKFTSDDVHFFQSVGNVLAEAISRKQAELQAAQLAAIVESSSDAIIGLDLDGVITSWNRGAEKTFGYAAAEMLGTLIRRLIPPDRLDEEKQVFGRIRQGENVEHFETDRITKGGRRINLSVAASPIRNGAGDVVGASAVARDITALKRTEHALRESEQRFRELAENIHEVFWMSDPENTRMIYISPAYEAIWGLSRETIYSSPASWMEAIHPEDKQRIVRARAHRNPALPHENNYRIIRPDGSVRWIRDRGFPVHDERGRVVRFAGIAEDITVRKRTAEAQERALSLMLATLESTADGILVVDTGGKIVAFNRLFARMWRLSDDVLASKEDARALDCVLDQLVEPEKFLEKVRYLYGHPAKESFDRLVFKDGRVFERYSRPQLIGGRVAGRVWSFRDATERRRAAKALEEANERLRFLSRRLFQVQEDERRHLARELHDEIGQTLTAAKINLQILAPEVPSKVSGRLVDSVQLLDRLLGQVRQLSLDLRPPLLDELGLVPTLRWLVDQQAQRVGLRITFHTNVNGLAIDPAIQTTCFRVAQEAITNIIRHSRAQKVVVLLRRRAGRLWLSVRDDGAGFDPSTISRETGHHSSLGLVSMKERMLLVRGGLEVLSAPGKGTEIRAWFPLALNGQRSRTDHS